MLFSQFPPPSTSSLDNGGAHSRPSRLRRLSNLRNYRSAVAGAVSSGNLARGSTSNSGSSSSTSSSNSANPTTARPAPDLHLTRSLTNTATAASSSPQGHNNNQGLSPSSSALSTGSSTSQPSQQHNQQNLAVGEHGDGNPLTQVNSAPNFATTSGVAVASRNDASNVNGSNPTSSAVSIASNPPADALQTAGETASISSQGHSDAAPPSTTPSEAPTPAPATTTSTDAAAAAPPTASAPAPAEPATMTRPRSSTTGEAATAAESATAPPTAATFLPSIRLSAYYDPRSTRPSLSFPPITRTLPSGTETIRVGRYSERDSQSTTQNQGLQPSAAPVGFKSKVVSRRHCEFWYENGKWYIKDVKSSSGTFLNHIRLSPPSQESKAFPVNDGDIVQLGIDFKGGEEMIFRCVKMRLELNRGWQNKLNTFK